LYKCSPAQYAIGEYDDCEVGDLSGKDGPLIVNEFGFAYGESDFPDPMAALNAQYVDERVFANFDKWGSIVFHLGSPRVLCAKIFKKECKVEFFLYNADTDEEVGPLQIEENSRLNEYNIEARPSADCHPTESAKLFLAGPLELERTERRAPFMLFGNDGSNIFGRDYELGDYIVSAVLYSKGNLQGDIVASGEFEFYLI
jgi:hypothetical protein